MEVNKSKNSDSWTWLLRSQSTKAKLLLLPLLVVVLAFQWPPLMAQFQSHFHLKHADAPGYPATGIFNPFSTNPLDGQLHLPNGKHYMLDFYGIGSAELAFLETADGEAFLAQEIVRSGMTVLGSRSHVLPGGGLSVVFLLSESHMSIHTWPEHSFAALDVYTCGGSSAADRLVDSLFALLKPGDSKVSYMERGSDHSHLIQVQREHGNIKKVKVEATLSSGQNPTVEHRILSGTDRPRPLVLPATIDLCVNAGFAGDECFLWRNASLLYSQQSEIQLVEVVHRQFGDRCLLLDGITQFCNSQYNELYTQSLSESVMQPLLTSTGTGSGGADVYVVGGGDGWIGTHLITAYPSLVRSIRVVDIDPLVAEVTQKFFPIAGKFDSFKDKRVEYITADAFLWLRNAPDNSADAVIIDCTDHTVESANFLYTDSFYSDVLRVLRPGGRFSQQMNTKDDSYTLFQQQIKESFLKIGFTDVMEWEVYIEDYGGLTVMMGGMKRKN